MKLFKLNAIFCSIFLAFLVAQNISHAEPPVARAQVDGLNVPKGVASDTYVIYRDFRIPVRYFDDREFPGYVKIIDADNVLWVAKRSDLGRLFERVLPKELDRVMKEANDFFDSHRISSALHEYLRVIRLLPKNPYLHLRIGQCYVMLNQEKEALEYFRSTLSLAPENHQAINELGLIAFSHGDFQEALQYFNKAYQKSRKAELYENNVSEAYLALADQYLASGKYKEAINQIEYVMAMLPEYSNTDLPPREESIFRKHLEFSREARLIERLPKKDEDELWVDAGKKLIKGKLWQESIALFRTLFEQKPENKTFKNYLISSYLNRGDELFADKHWEEAVANYQEAKAYIPTEQLYNQAMFKFLIQKGREEYDRKNWVSSIKQLDLIYRIVPENEEVKNKLSDSLFQVAKLQAKDFMFQEAIESALAANKILPSRKFRMLVADMHVEIGLMALNSRKWVAALQEFNEAKKMDPLNWRAKRYYIEAWVSKFFAESFWIATLVFSVATALLIFISMWSTLVIRKRRLSRLRSLAEAAFGANNWADAVQHYEAYRRVAGKLMTVEIMERIARSYVELGEYNNAILNYTKAEELLGGEKRYLLERCKIFALKGNAELTMQYLRESPDLLTASQTLLEYTQDLLRQERNEQTRERLSEVVGAIHLVRGEKSTARSIFEDLHQNHPRSRYPLRKLIDLSKSEGDQTALKKYLEKYLEQDPINPAVIFELGEYYESIGRKKEALDRYAEAYEISPLEKIRDRIRTLAKEFALYLTSSESETVSSGLSNTASLRQIVETLMEIRDHESALEILQKLSSLGVSDLWVTRAMGDCFFAMLIDDMAIKYFRRFLEQYRRERDTVTPDEVDKTVSYNLGRVYERKGLIDLALKEFQAIYEHDMKFRDIALKIPVLYENKMREEQLLEEKEERIPVAQRLLRPAEGQIRCPKCLNVIANDTVHCPFCSCKVGFTEHELEDQATKRKARLGSEETPLLPRSGLRPEES